MTRILVISHWIAPINLEKQGPSELGNARHLIIIAIACGKDDAKDGRLGPTVICRVALAGEAITTLCRVGAGRISGEIDIAVIGAGGGGFSAALTAAESGLSVAIYEAADAVGGTFALSAGQVWAAGTRQEREAGIEDSAEDGLRHARRLSAGRHDENILITYMHELPGVLEYLETKFGIEHDVVRNLPDYYSEFEGGRAEGRYLVPTTFDRSTLPPEWRDRLVIAPVYAHIPASYSEVMQWGGFRAAVTWDWELLGERLERGVVGFGSSTMGHLLKATLDAGIEICLEHKLVELDRDGDAWLLSFDTPGGSDQIRARNVVLATGGHDRSPRLQGMLDIDPAPVAAGLETVDGGAVQLALENGASFAVGAGQILLPTTHIAGNVYRGQPVRHLLLRETALPGGIVVNRQGRRFADESFYRDLVHEMVRFDAKTQTYPNREAFLIVDEGAREKYQLASLAPGHTPPSIVSAETAAELAVQLDVDPVGLVQTITRYNEFAQSGEDPDFGRGERAFSRGNGDPSVEPNPTMRPLRGRLYAVPVETTTVGSSGGLRFDSAARVLDWRDRPIAGLYCAGNSGAAQVEGLWYNSGIANGRGLLFGHRAALDAAGLLE